MTGIASDRLGVPYAQFSISRLRLQVKITVYSGRASLRTVATRNHALVKIGYGNSWKHKGQLRPSYAGPSDNFFQRGILSAITLVEPIVVWLSFR